MFKKRLLWQLYPSYLILILIVLLSIFLYVSFQFKSFLVNNMHSDIEIRAKLVKELASKYINQQDSLSIKELCEKTSTLANARVTIISKDGIVLGDSSNNKSIKENHSTRPEVIEALKDKTAYSIRYSHTLKTNMMYIAIPVNKNKIINAVVRLSVPFSFIDKTLNDIYFKMLLAGLLIAIIASLFSFNISRHIKKPLEEIDEGVKNFSRGNLDYIIPVPPQSEIANLVNTLNSMARELNEKMQLIIKQKRQQQAVFSSMQEGVIAVDSNRKIIKINNAAANLLNVKKEDVIGLKIKEITGKTELHNFIKKAFINNMYVEENITLNLEENLFLHVRSTILKDERDKKIGAIIVLNNLTNLRKLENIRKDFVANVSHELRTPITSIKGFVETLLEEDTYDADKSRHFLNIIKKHTSRLNYIIEDLLSLSKMEHDYNNLEAIECNLKNIIDKSIDICDSKAKDKNIKIKSAIENNIIIKANPSLIEQALVNLIDNAIKYSNADVILETKLLKDKVEIKVQDFGDGIPKEHHSRLFERFYRVDKSRSRKEGGTGLGLAIVKHIVQVHRGQIHLESEVSRGSIFSIYLPLN